MPVFPPLTTNTISELGDSFLRLDNSNQASWTPSTTLVANLNADLLDGKNTGTSGNVIPLLDGANTWTATQTFGTDTKLQFRNSNNYIYSPGTGNQLAISSGLNLMQINDGSDNFSIDTFFGGLTLASDGTATLSANSILQLTSGSGAADTNITAAAINFTSGAPIFNFTDSTASEDDFRIAVNTSAFTLSNSTDTKTIISMDSSWNVTVGNGATNTLNGPTTTANQFTSTLATGTAPLVIASTTLVTNLNADLLDGKNTGTSGNTIPLLDGVNTFSGATTFSSTVQAKRLTVLDTGAANSSPLVVKNTDLSSGNGLQGLSFNLNTVGRPTLTGLQADGGTNNLLEFRGSSSAGGEIVVTGSLITMNNNTTFDTLGTIFGANVPFITMTTSDIMEIGPDYSALSTTWRTFPVQLFYGQNNSAGTLNAGYLQFVRKNDGGGNTEVARFAASGNLQLNLDNQKLLWGGGQDASIYYDGTDMFVNPKEVGTGTLKVLGDITLSTFNLITDTSTGTKIGTGTTQKLGFWNTTPAVQPPAYTITNDTTDRTYDANATTVEELADVVATMYRDLKVVGIFA